MEETLQVQFLDDVLIVKRDPNGQIWAALAPICSGLGIDHNGQRQRLQRSHWATTCMMHAVAADGRQREMCFVHINTIPMWLATLEIDRINPALYEKLRAYQTHAAQFLASTFSIYTVAQQPGATAGSMLDKLSRPPYGGGLPFTEQSQRLIAVEENLAQINEERSDMARGVLDYTLKQMGDKKP